MQGLTQEWKDEPLHLFVLTVPACKPVFALHGDVLLLSPICSLL
ncbi:hypothetical protein KIPB_014274, partial [Kipferlia bialata]|eukprot:g14274.t1